MEQCLNEMSVHVLNHQIYMNAMGHHCPITVIDESHEGQSAEAVEFKRDRDGDLRVKLIGQPRFIKLDRLKHKLSGVLPL